MECPTCGRGVDRGDRFCNGCGTSLHGVTDATQLAATVLDDDTEATGHSDGDGSDQPTSAARGGAAADATDATDATDVRTELLPVMEDEEWEDDPAWARTGAVPVEAAARAETHTNTTDLPATEPITEVWMSVEADEQDPPDMPYDFAAREVVAVTETLPTQDATSGPTEQMPAVAVTARPDHRPALGLVTFIAVVAGAVSLLALFADIVTITSDVRITSSPEAPVGFRTGNWIADDLADNLSIAGFLAVLAMVAGGVGAAFRWRWGSGLAGGGGLAMAGLAALTVGLAQFPIDAARQFALIPTDDPFVLTITRDLGYWLLIAAGALGVVLFFASINDAVGDHRSGLNPWIAALGALAVVVAVAGPLIPENRALFSDNWYLVEAPGEPSALLLVGRFVQLGLLAIGGVVGFLSVRRWGLGAAIGASLPAIWLTISVLFELTDRPVGVAFRNPGAEDMHVHGVTIIGISAIMAMAVLGAIAAYDQSVRERA